ncbi:hypothetical protein [uncultured Winogradskyella sp.]|uniref:hypothetical protein n=1 Tax=uncultured Winogradskyella sp. TaxID=395353 RepID=UPI002630F51D|nr:hypothetical protein [uncultured Winogradskyella sp.]
MNFKKSKNLNRSIRIVEVKRTVCLMLVMALFSTFNGNAQTVPDPPKPPKTEKGTSYSISIDNDDDVTNNSSVSISISDDSYKFRASYHKSKNESVKAILLEKLGKANLKINGNTYLWSDNQSGDEVFECKLTKGHLRMYVDTEVASKGFVEKINKLGNELKYFISGTDPKKEEAKKAERAKRDLERAERELAKAKRELAKAEREAKRAKGN